MTTTKRCFRKPLALLVLAALGASMMILLASPAWAAAITVNTTADNVTEDDLCSLREAITTANSDTPVGVGGAGNDCVTGSGADTIGFDPSLTGQTITLGSQLPAITSAGGALTIDGGSANITVSGNLAVQVVEVGSGAKLTLNKLTVANADFSAIINRGTLEVSDSTFSDNTSDRGGGAILSLSGSVTVSNSTFSRNSTPDGGDGGAINADGGTTLEVSNSTFSGNSADDGGGGAIWVQDSTADITNSTFFGNSADFGGGISSDFNSNITVHNTLFAGNPTGGNCSIAIAPLPALPGTITDGGGNLDDGETCGFTASSSKSSTPAGLDPAGLKDNGGPTQTIALCSGVNTPTDCTGPSAAIDAAVSCPPPPTDQRGVSRLQGTACDIGAYEVEVVVEDTTPPTVTTSTPTNKAANVTATFSEEVQNVSPETFFLERRISVKKTEPPKYVRVDATVSLSTDGKSAELNPTLDLPKGDYRATITTDVTDLADPANALEEPVVWTFKVAK